MNVLENKSYWSTVICTYSIIEIRHVIYIYICIILECIMKNNTQYAFSFVDSALLRPMVKRMIYPGESF